MELTYKTATLEDANVIYLLNKENMDNYEDISSFDYNYLLDWLKEDIKKAIHEYQVIYLNKEKVGYYCLHDQEEETELVDFYLLKDYRHQGIGKVVLNKIIQDKTKPLYLCAFTKNTEAIHFYKKFGFKIKEQLSPTRLMMYLK